MGELDEKQEERVQSDKMIFFLLLIFNVEEDGCNWMVMMKRWRMTSMMMIWRRRGVV